MHAERDAEVQGTPAKPPRWGIGYLRRAPAKPRRRASPVTKPAVPTFEPDGTTTRGKVRFFDSRVRFFGFITADDGRDVYVHRNKVKKGQRLYPGTEVEFVVQASTRGKSGMEATKVKVVS